MLTTTSAYHAVAANLRENGYHAIPQWPGRKIPGQWNGASWDGLSGWSKYCDTMPPDFIHSKWERWPDAGVCVAHGNIVGLDLDTDRPDVAEALHRAVEPSDVRRRGSKGWMGYYRPGDGLEEHTARVRWHDKDGGVVVEILLHGTQSLIPPTIHPGTGQPYVWVMSETLENTDISDLPILSGEDIAALDREFSAIGLTRKVPKSAGKTDYARQPSTPDLQKPFGRSLNDRAMEPSAIDQWWPALNMPKTKQRGSGAWEAIAFWRASGSGRAVHDRNPNLKITPHGIRDFGDDKPYTPADVVMAANACGFEQAAEFLKQFIREESGHQIIEINTPESDDQFPETEPEPDHDPDMPTLASLMASGQPFPDVTGKAGGVLADIYTHMRSAMRRDWPAAAFVVSLNIAGVLIGRNYATWTDLRSNLYTVILAKSGWGKSSIYSPAVDLLIHAGLKDMVGAERIMSDSGLIQEIHTHPEHKKIYFLDEFGHMLQRCNDRGAGGHVRKIVTEFTNLYSKANGYYAGSAYADGSRDSTMQDPHINIFGMATPGQFWEAFGSGAIEDGTLPRFSILDAVYRPVRKVMDAKHIDAIKASRDALAPRLRDLAIKRQTKQGNLATAPGALPEAVRVMPSDDALRAWMEIEDHAETLSIEAEISHPDRDFGGILARVAETAAKIALIFAVTHDPDNPRIEIGDIIAGRQLAWWFASVAIKGVISHVSDNDYQALQQKALDFIKAGNKGRRSKRDLCKRMKMKVREVDEIIATLEASGLITQERTTPLNGGTPTIWIKMEGSTT